MLFPRFFHYGDVTVLEMYPVVPTSLSKCDEILLQCAFPTYASPYKISLHSVYRWIAIMVQAYGGIFTVQNAEHLKAVFHDKLNRLPCSLSYAQICEVIDPSKDSEKISDFVRHARGEISGAYCGIGIIGLDTERANFYQLMDDVNQRKYTHSMVLKMGTHITTVTEPFWIETEQRLTHGFGVVCFPVFAQ